MPRVPRKRLASDQALLEVREADASGIRGRQRRIIKDGLPPVKLVQQVERRRRDAAQFRAGVAMLLSREEFVERSGWSLTRLRSVEKFVEEEDRRTNAKLDPKQIFAEYQTRQLQAARELDDLAEVFKRTGSFASLVTAIKARSDILDKIVKMGQELGVISRAAREHVLKGELDIRAMSVSELRMHLQAEVAEVASLLDPSPESGSVAGKILTKILGDQRTVGPEKAALTAARQDVPQPANTTKTRNAT